jgi:AraC-like DNA-binding protein
MLESGARQFDAESLLVTTLHALVARHGLALRPASPDTPVVRVVETAREYLHAYYASPIKLASLAAVCGTSPFHLVRCFTETLGIPPHAYLTQIRANRARALLMQGETVSGVAYRCGFCDQSHLTRVFKRLFGVTPGSYVAALLSS